MIKDCRLCDKYINIGEGFGMCGVDELPVTVVADYEPTKNFLKCMKEECSYDEESWKVNRNF